MSLEIIIWTAAKASGKTSLLEKYFFDDTSKAGVLSPRIASKRYFRSYPDLEEILMDDHAGELHVGVHRFDASAFQFAEKKLNNYLKDESIKDIIIDEIGPLEIKQKKGFHSFLNKLAFETDSWDKRIHLVVRDRLLISFLEFYPFRNLQIRKLSKLPEKSPLTGLILCGGESRRMGRDKALICYHGKAQYLYLHDMLSLFCEQTYLSLNEKQMSEMTMESTIPKVQDKDHYKNHGPLTGILSAIEELGARDFFIMACDFPLIEMKHLAQLFIAHNESNKVSHFRCNGKSEPLLSILGKDSVPMLLEYFNDGSDSFHKFIMQNNSNPVDLLSDDFLHNANFPNSLLAKNLKIES